MLTGVLAKAGALVMRANRQQDAIAVISSRDPELVFLDLARQDSDGWNVLRFIRESQPYMLPKTIAMIGNSCDWFQGQLLQDCQTVDMLQPFFVVNLVAKACRALRNNCESLAACPMNASCMEENMM